MPDRDAFLRRVDEQLPFIAEQRADVLEELRGHLDESVAGLIDGGWDPVGAEEEALRRLGDPDALARDIGRSQQTNRRLLAAAGGAVFNLGLSVLAGYVFLVPVALIALAVFALLTALGLTDGRPEYPTNSAVTQATIWMCIAWMSGLLLPQAVARGAHRSLAWARMVLVRTYLPLLVAWVVLGVTARFEPVSIAAFAVVPVAAWLGMRRATESVPSLRSRQTFLPVMLLAAAMLTVGALAARPSEEFDTPYDWDVVEEPERLNLGLVGALTDPAVDLTERGYLWRDGNAAYGPTAQRWPIWAGYPTVLLEVWPATEDGFRIHPSATGPLARATVSSARPPQDARFTLDILGQRVLLFPREVQPRYRKWQPMGATIPPTLRAEWGRVWAVLVGVTDDGRRQVLEWSPSNQPLRFNGTILQWLTADRSPRPIAAD